MKQLINTTTGRTLDIAFTGDTTDIKIFNYVSQNIELLNDSLNLDLNEPWSCGAEFDEDERTIEINGDEDLAFFNIKNLNVIKI